ncbi:MAG: L-histidine N(alpha)-methyltransferase [Myxococcales bacterium]|nr:L-histidine N(alpha)-methyltransferase [Myxococcales bacterium]
MTDAARFTLIRHPSSGGAVDFARDVHAGLTATPKRLPFPYFYDEEGSRLFEAICGLPEYYLTRAEAEILGRHAGAIVAPLPPSVELVELGSGSATKTRLLLDALLARRPSLRYLPIDISETMLEESARGLLADYPSLQVTAIAAEYRSGLRILQDQPRAEDSARLVLWLGSNVGNFHRPDAARFLAEVRATMALRDRLLLGADLRKERTVLERAYDDAAGVTARFNLNLLARINRELGGHFAVDQFRHLARYDEPAGRIEMYLVSERDQAARIDGLGIDLTFAAGERIHTEDSYKYSQGELAHLAAAAGFTVEDQWMDEAGRFAVSRFAPA